MISMKRERGEGRLQEINQDGESKKYIASLERENGFHKTSVGECAPLDHSGDWNTQAP